MLAKGWGHDSGLIDGRGLMKRSNNLMWRLIAGVYAAGQVAIVTQTICTIWRIRYRVLSDYSHPLGWRTTLRSVLTTKTLNRQRRRYVPAILLTFFCGSWNYCRFRMDISNSLSASLNWLHRWCSLAEFATQSQAAAMIMNQLYYHIHQPALNYYH